ncbi:PepSY-associated TM helix domain-containing protein [Stenotrophomonas oahuensis]|uniref:PepSY-associated TM helix domain-containing protein n=1 Tax=Stenotrophomonas oahuensis TaxID=3003271 RepID=A0ABY9YKK0_9GAMM|nr:PepSY-associated TM helix domain-containing protein [Stenotrophomonas sp. A5586]WNH51381.1 PepSY-associated TM helix domain-containing protein [Stenotrophomonas sp. A5586]
MSQGFRQSQAVLHTWSGLVVGWVLYLIFIAGTASYWRNELTRWMQPELGLPATSDVALDHAQHFLAHTAPDAKRWSIELPGSRSNATTVRWQPKDAPEPKRGQPNPWQATLDASGNPVQARDTRGGDFFYRLHFDLHYVPALWARWFVCFCTMFMLVAIISGVITHKKIFADFFSFRRGKGQRSWLDGHNALAVLSLPFHLMITYTGLITLMTVYMPWAVQAKFGSRDAFFAELFPREAKVQPAGQRVVMPALATLMDSAQRQWGDGHAASVVVDHPGDAAMRITFRRDSGDRIADNGEALRYDAQGALQSPVTERSAAVFARDGMIGLHAARFAPTLMRWLFFLSGVAGTLMVATGLVLWTVKRREQLPDPVRPPRAFRFVERMNIGFVAGLPLAMLAFLWGNRLLPVSLDARAQAEISVFFAAWVLCLLHASLRAPRRAWVEQLSVAGVLGLLLPVFNLLAWKGGLFSAFAVGDAATAGIDLGLALIGVALLWTARKVHRHVPVARRGRASRDTPLVAGGAGA